jgi:hypothetical protein
MQGDTVEYLHCVDLSLAWHKEDHGDAFLPFCCNLKKAKPQEERLGRAKLTTITLFTRSNAFFSGTYGKCEKLHAGAKLNILIARERLALRDVVTHHLPFPIKVKRQVDMTKTR